MARFPASFVVSLLLLLTVPRSAIGQAEEDEPNPATIALVAEVTHVIPGTPFYVGLHLQMPEGYHTYWKGNGIVGVATQIDWSLPEGFTAAPIEWPVPMRVDMISISAHGYHDEVLLPIRITPPKELTGDTVVLKGNAIWMCCAKSCHPGFQPLEITLPVARNTEAGGPQKNADWAPKFDASRSRQPQTSEDWETQVLQVTASHIDLAIRPTCMESGRSVPPNVYFFSEDNHIYSDLPQIAQKQDDGSLVLRLARSEYGAGDPTTLPGLLYCDTSWGDADAPRLQHIRVDPRLPEDVPEAVTPKEAEW